tara:strand:- start:28975 stop:29079 length:105 start_codon:yes stop_codon:yes gene_type:complete
MNTIKEVWKGLSKRGKILAVAVIVIAVLVVINSF